MRHMPKSVPRILCIVYCPLSGLIPSSARDAPLDRWTVYPPPQGMDSAHPQDNSNDACSAVHMHLVIIFELQCWTNSVHEQPGPFATCINQGYGPGGRRQGDQKRAACVTAVCSICLCVAFLGGAQRAGGGGCGRSGQAVPHPQPHSSEGSAAPAAAAAGGDVSPKVFQKAQADVLLHCLHYALPGWDAAAERRDASEAQVRASADGDFDADHGLGLDGVGRSAH
jgi:hypothetical protein